MGLIQTRLSKSAQKKLKIFIAVNDLKTYEAGLNFILENMEIHIEEADNVRG